MLTDNAAADAADSVTKEQLSNAVLDNIYGRRSVRNFSDKEVSDEIIKELIRAGTYAPTAMNQQPWRFVVVKSRRLIEEYDERAKKLFVAAHKDTPIPALAGYVRALSNPEVRLFFRAPVLILVFASPGIDVDYDCALAAGNMMLAAHSLGIGSCWIGLARHLGEDAEFLKGVGVPEGYKLIAPLIFGYPAWGNPKAPPRNPGVILKWMS